MTSLPIPCSRSSGENGGDDLSVLAQRAALPQKKVKVEAQVER